MPSNKKKRRDSSKEFLHRLKDMMHLENIFTDFYRKTENVMLLENAFTDYEKTYCISKMFFYRKTENVMFLENAFTM